MTVYEWMYESPYGVIYLGGAWLMLCAWGVSEWAGRVRARRARRRHPVSRHPQ